MSYHEEVQDLSEEDIQPGDVLRVEKKEEVFEGVLMPRTEQGKRDSIVLKLESGYNIGLEISDDIKIEKLGETEEGEVNAGIDELKEKTNIDNSEDKPEVSILAAGGTIASRIDYRTGAVKPSFTEENLISFTPEIASLADIDGRQLFQALSENLTPEHWQEIAEAVKEEVENGKDGVVVMHGTDTMGYTAAALSFMLENLPVPVVLVGSQRSSDRGSSDAHQNLVCAVKAATTDIAEVMVCMHGESSDNFCYLHPGTKVRKMHTSRRDAFRTINTEPIAKVSWDGLEVEIMDDYQRKDKDRDLQLKDEFNNNIALVKTHPGITAEDLEKRIEGKDGVILEGTGLGHIPLHEEDSEIRKVLEKYIDEGGLAFMTSQCLYGRVNMNVYETGVDLQELGVLGNFNDMLPETAYVKLGWLLGNYSKEEVGDLMVKNLRGEISQRSRHNEFGTEGE